ncbi:Altered inheritance of mitochondria protein 6 [Cercospora beticola]|uniref:Altered inheritance of mitochondria protein 6 n=1 Tax=Cercospora beticola TaxID=122368 RepID=A0A2G5GM19_CERBT|nr:Altered inheritance of mitochondria protein 6 [Cercospora beticola]PIA81335.1 Altered inheritance of mitochondria protein 6 [Cercospora beticola]WPA97560.1 hypothetical protein RHO25_002170 [Cercospora beticola]
MHLVLVTRGHDSVSRAIYAQRMHACTPDREAYSVNQPTENTTPIPCHSHNDYWRNKPLFDAIHAGCTSVEADIWLDESNEALQVGHFHKELSQNRTLQKLYIEPLLGLLDRQNPADDNTTSGIFPMAPNQTLTLLLDFKTDPSALLAHVIDELEYLREQGFLSYCQDDRFVEGAVTVVATGDIPPSLFSQDSAHNRTIFTDVPLDKLEDFTTSFENATNPKVGPCSSHGGYYASTSFHSSIGSITRGSLSSDQVQLIRRQVAAAQRAGLKARYWDTPSWPTSLRNYVWQTLIDEGVDVLNVDDLCYAAFLDWEAVPHKLIDG